MRDYDSSIEQAIEEDKPVVSPKESEPELSSDDIHPFGGCDRSLGHYKAIGVSLLKIESGSFVYGYSSQRSAQEFRENVATVPVETLESYLEDLLDRHVNLDVLFISRPGLFNSVDALTIASLAGSCMVGMYISWVSNTPIVGALATLLLSLPVVTVWYRSPFGSLARRVNFARIVSREVARRRGGGIDKDDAGINSGFSLRHLLGGDQEVLGSAPARRTYH
jgi:hypothetical protein